MKRLLPVCISVIAFLFSMGVCAQQPAADAVLTAMQQELDRWLANLKKTPTPPYFLSSITVVSRSPHPSARLPAVPIKPHAISTSIFAWETTRGVGAACPKPGAPSVHVIDANRRKTENRMGNNRVTSFSYPGFSTDTSRRRSGRRPGFGDLVHHIRLRPFAFLVVLLHRGLHAIIAGGKNSGRRSVNIRNMWAVHTPTPFTW